MLGEALHSYTSQDLRQEGGDEFKNAKSAELDCVSVRGLVRKQQLCFGEVSFDAEAKRRLEKQNKISRRPRLYRN